MRGRRVSGSTPGPVASAPPRGAAGALQPGAFICDEVRGAAERANDDRVDAAQYQLSHFARDVTTKTVTDIVQIDP